VVLQNTPRLLLLESTSTSTVSQRRRRRSILEKSSTPGQLWSHDGDGCTTPDGAENSERAGVCGSEASLSQSWRGTRSFPARRRGTRAVRVDGVRGGHADARRGVHGPPARQVEKRPARICPALVLITDPGGATGRRRRLRRATVGGAEPSSGAGRSCWRRGVRRGSLSYSGSGRQVGSDAGSGRRCRGARGFGWACAAFEDAGAGMRSDRVPRDGAAALRLCLPGLPRRAVVDCATPVIVLAPRPRDHDPGGPDSGVPRVGKARHFFLGDYSRRSPPG
jgi:hypothetical protein